jgi:hypothetical protein
VNVVDVGTAVMVYVPLRAELFRPATTTESPAANVCATDVVTVYASTANLSFGIFGSEIS